MDKGTDDTLLDKDIDEEETPENCDNSDHDGQHENPVQAGDSGWLGFCLNHTLSGECPTPDCAYQHCELCQQCGTYCLDPRDERQRHHHRAGCMLKHAYKEDSSVQEVSREKTCNICLEVVFEKAARKRRFGLLPNCMHTFCITCIREWRRSDADATLKRCCPVCRISSSFVVPSYFWIEDEKEKKDIIESYKNGCSLTDCKHFKKGQGFCPFGVGCFYRHALPSGELVKKVLVKYRKKQKRAQADQFTRAANFRAEQWLDEWQPDSFVISDE